MRSLLISLILTSMSLVALADEGMWTFNNFPTKKVQDAYKFKATPAWLDHVRLSSARIAGGCSASFVSANGLVMTNHHCAHSCIQQLSKSGKDYVASGFYAKTEKDEVKCPEIEINRLVQISDVTDRVRAQTKGATGKEFNDQLKAAMSKIEKECSQDSADVRCEVVTLYHGGLYQLYKYQRYQDVRLVFAPEFAIAFFGGDPDNFMFPRYDLDVSFLRVYDKDRPLENKEYFKWSKAGAADQELTFVTGHPGHTSREFTVAQLEFTRDMELVQDLIYYSEARGIWTEFQNRGPEQKRISGDKLFGIENQLKRLKGEYEALLDKSMVAKKVAQENALRKRVNANPKWRKEYGNAWNEIKSALEQYKKMYFRYGRIEYTSMGSRLFMTAKSLVRAATELQKPNEKRFREYADSALPQLKQRLLSEAPIYNDVEIAGMTFALTKMREQVGVDDPLVKKIFGQKSPAQLAEFLVKNTQLADVETRKKLFDGGEKAIQDSHDPMILFARLIDPETREIRRKYEDEIETKIKQNTEKIAKARFAIEGMKNYPDATFTLRISYGQVKGYEENGNFVKPFTTMGGAFDRATGSFPFALPDSWLKAKDQMNLATPFNFVSTNDIIGGNSGSPVINKNAEVVGLIFDGNIQSLGGEYAFDEKVNRAVSVHSSALLESLKKIYGAQRVVNDILGTSESATVESTKATTTR